ncbi:hypothetical protein AMTR_s00099p00157080 [Amborella trichopoda]|uniref:FAD-binding FR-type domain-containing protein n=1 Tax=Amborella trichopoda TaxID=13333 RepID=W1NWU4_AMBTC|nr:hypothetical protein AMTR_s00099p00157080 [Amborella trichopoda]
MDEHTVQDPLLSDGARIDHGVKKPGLLSSIGKCVFKIFLWAIFLAWVAVIFLFPSDFVRGFYLKYIFATRKSVFESSGGILLVFSAPIILVAILGMIYITIFPRQYLGVKKRNFPSFHLWTFPVIVDGPFGVVSAAEFVGIVLVIAYVLWSLSAYIIRDSHTISELSVSTEEKSYLMLEFVGLRLGSIGLFLLAFLFLPIARGSSLLRLIDIPFEHATKYHVWLGHLTMAIFTAHGLCYVVAWALKGNLIHEILEWKNIGIANLPGVISLLAGLLMWVTSLHPVRKTYFELFFYTHQLYVVFVVFLALHVGLQYNALSFIFVQIRELSWLQWHPFSVSSCPLDGRFHLAVLIKVLGDWTEKLRDTIENAAERSRKGLSFQNSVKMTASVEGPYGHESAYHLNYENIILVAGGIGISPFVAVLRDILHRIEEKRPCAVKNVLIVWAIKRSDELCLLSAVDAKSICPSFSDLLNLDIQIYVTQETEPALEDGNLSKITNQVYFPKIHGNHVSSLVGTGNTIWSGMYLAVSTVGFIILMGQLGSLDVSMWWLRGLLLVVCMVASVALFGGLVIILWHYWERRVANNKDSTGGKETDESKHHGEPTAPGKTQEGDLVDLSTIQYGHRPNFEGILDSVIEKWGHVDVGVMVCGPPSLESTVAAQCRSRNIMRRWNQPILHFNTHSFEL